MRLLKAIDNSVLWLLRDNIVAERNLRKEAVLRGIDPRRLVFAEILTQEEHLARQRLADLFLDTLPVNAHTTASNALWAGLPILTCCGQAFSGRVAASLLHAIGLAELVTHSLDEYEAAALRLALRTIRSWRPAKTAPEQPVGLPAIRHKSLPPQHRGGVHNHVGALSTQSKPAKL